MTDYAVTPPCGVPGHDRGSWEDDELGIWWCPDCEEQHWTDPPKGREMEIRYARPTSKIPERLTDISDDIHMSLLRADIDSIRAHLTL